MEYHKIDTVFKRDMASKYKNIMPGEFSKPEFEYLADCEWIFTEKVDGTNIRVIVYNSVQFGGKTDNAQIPAPLFSRLSDRFMPQRDLLAEMFPNGAILYGEGYGARIQKAGANYRKDQDFVLFDVRVSDWWLRRADVEGVATKLGVDVVPIVGRGTLNDAVAMCRAGLTSRWGDFEAEGIVARTPLELRNRAGARIITKIKCRDFR